MSLSGWLPHELKSKIGILVVLLCNINVTTRLCNGTRVMACQFTNRVVEAEVLLGECARCIVLISKLSLENSNCGLPYSVRQKQFPIRVAFATSSNKIPRLDASKGGIHLTMDGFSHGQLYVAFLRATAPENILVLLKRIYTWR